MNEKQLGSSTKSPKQKISIVNRRFLNPNLRFDDIDDMNNLKIVQSMAFNMVDRYGGIDYDNYSRKRQTTKTKLTSETDDPLKSKSIIKIKKMRMTM